MSVKRQASFSRCGQYRYQLSRQFDAGEGRCVFIGLNPSIASARDDDPTVRRCMGFAQRWGYAELVVVNLFAFRTPYPAQLKIATDPIGPRNARAVRRACQSAQCIVAAWGAHGSFHNQARKLVGILTDKPVYCFGLTRSGQPVHPLYQKSDAELVVFRSSQD